MSRQRKKKTKNQKPQEAPPRFSHLPEIRGALLCVGSALLFIALVTFSAQRPADNWLGMIGHSIAFTFRYLLGLVSYVLLAFNMIYGWLLFTNQKERPFFTLATLCGLCLLSLGFLFNLFAENYPQIAAYAERFVHCETYEVTRPTYYVKHRYNLGGVPLYYLYQDLPYLNLHFLLSNVGTGIIFSSILSVCSWFLLKPSIRKRRLELVVASPGGATLSLPKEEKPKTNSLFSRSNTADKPAKAPILSVKLPKVPSFSNPLKAKEPPAASSSQEPRVTGSTLRGTSKDGYRLPPEDLLSLPKKQDLSKVQEQVKQQAQILEDTLASFGIEAKVGEVHCGPTIVSFEVHPAVGVKVQKIKALENDIALNLQAASIRILAPIPGKAVVGIEVPSLSPQEVSFREMLAQYKPGSMHIPLLLGKSVSGEEVLTDLTRMPHLIIAGATGSGKSVCINTIIMSILMNSGPEEVRLLMVDPKKVELSNYSKLPHMIAPVITEAHGAYGALKWLVREMESRYELLRRLGFRNIQAFNARKPIEADEKACGLEVPPKLPYIVCIVDELADLMMSSSNDIETPITRIAQMARAVGIHLILATQRPSREVITGLIKANFPTRIAFKVASRINSQIILDDMGAESLLGNGDMLFLPPGTASLTRAQGVFIRDEDINRVIRFVTEQCPVQYQIKSFDQMTFEDLGGDAKAPNDALFEQAKATILEAGLASTTFLQRKLKIGYARAASLIDELESHGIVGPQEGSKPRRVLVKADEDNPNLPGM